jgi:hypothetical protein
VHVVEPAVQLVRLRHEAVEHLHGDGHESRVRDPGAVVTVACLALLVGAHLGDRSIVGAGSFLIGICAAMPPIANAPRRCSRLDEQLRVRAQEMRRHRHLLRSGSTNSG